MAKILKNRDGTAAVEAAVVVPLFVVLTLGISDIGGGVFARMAVNAASQAGASYAASNPAATLGQVQTAMEQAAASSSFCTSPQGLCTASLQSACSPAPAQCVVTVTATHSWTPWLPVATYSWAIPTAISFTTTIRVL